MVISVLVMTGLIATVSGFGLGFYYARKYKLPQTPTKSLELIEFMRDLDVKGYGLVRIEPDSVFHVSSRMQ